MQCPTSDKRGCDGGAMVAVVATSDPICAPPSKFSPSLSHNAVHHQICEEPRWLCSAR
ncbi:AI-2E family transporter [Sesbania bispinosa]|nr:AI-2E family transporter [Sesbania bispinosa]